MDLRALVNIEWGLTSTHILPIDNGLINRTWLIRTTTADFILQNVNTIVFKDVVILQEQLVSVARQIALPKLVPLYFLPTLKGAELLRVKGQTFRLARAITPSKTLTEATVINVSLATQALLEFHEALSHITFAEWQQPITGFLDVQKRLEAYQFAKAASNTERQTKATQTMASLEAKWDYLLDWQHFLEKETKVLIHADPKLSNFLFHPNGREVRALIDWDTIQLGSPYYDYGDMIRSYCSFGEEIDADQPLFRKEIYEAIQAALQVDPLKLKRAACGVIMVQALRFLTDYLQNDQYYRVKDAEHNLRRAANQLRMVEELNAFWLTTQKRAH